MPDNYYPGAIMPEAHGAPLGARRDGAGARPIALALDRSDKAIEVLSRITEALVEQLQPSLAGNVDQSRRGGEASGPSSTPPIGSSQHVSHILTQGTQIAKVTDILRYLHEALEV